MVRRESTDRWLVAAGCWLAGMVQVLLRDRFHLKAHWETKDGEIYNTVTRNRAKLREPGNAPRRE